MRKIKRLVCTIVVISIISSMLCVGALADGSLAYGAATVAGPSLNLRSGPGTSYSVVTQLNEGDIVVILECTNSEWYHINYHGDVGYVNVPFLRDVLTAENFSAKGKIIGDSVNIRSKPTITSDILGTYSQGTIMTVIGINNGWYKVKHDGLTGYLRSDFMDIIGGYSSSSDSSGASSSAASSSGSSSNSASSSRPAPPPDLAFGEQVVYFAMDYLGSKYVYGGTSPSGFDCSGFVYYVYKNFGYTLARGATSLYKSDGVKIAKSELSAGDLVFFSSNGGSSITHVGLYIGDNEFIHASTPSSGVVISRLDSTYYLNVWYGAKRIVTG